MKPGEARGMGGETPRPAPSARLRAIPPVVVRRAAGVLFVVLGLVFLIVKGD